MTAFVDWVLAKRYRLIVLAIALTPLLPFVTTALMVLESARRGALVGLSSALFGLAGVVIFAMMSGSSVIVWVGVAAIGMLGGVAVGALLRWAGSLALTFQGTVLACALIGIALSVLFPDPALLFSGVIEELVEILRESGRGEGQLDLVRSLDRLLMGLMVAALFAQLVGGLLLGHWWLHLARRAIGFGVEFRALKLGRVLGIPAMLLIALGLILDAPLIDNLTPLALFGFLFQGLAVLHAWAYAKNWHAALIVPVYVLLITPLTGLAIMGLSVVGLVDNLFDLRSSLRAQT